MTCLQYGQPTRLKNIIDGASRTALLTEKRRVGKGLDGGDDRGWADGWDLDTIRSTLCSPLSDSAPGVGGFSNVIGAGSSHSNGVNVVMADGAVRYIRFGVDVETWNQLGHRSDSQFLDSRQVFVR